MVSAAIPHVLVVEDDPTISEVVVRYLEREGLDVEAVADGRDALDAAAATWPDLVVLDLMLPGIDGLEVCRRLRAQAPVPVIMLTARGDEEDRVLGLELGADDYVVKPFSPRELTARVRAVLRRASGTGTPDSFAVEVIDAGGLCIDLQAREVTRDGTSVSLTAREFDLLAHLARHPRRAFSREELLERVWGYTFGDTATVTVHVRRLREKVEPDAVRAPPPGDGLGRGLPVGSVSRRWQAPLLTLLVGAALTLIVAIATSMTDRDTLELVGIAAGVALIGVLLGVPVLRVLRNRALGLQIAALTLVIVGSVALGAFVAARAMFISSHDLAVVEVVLIAAATVGVAAAVWLGGTIAATSSSLVDVTRRIGTDPGRDVPAVEGAPEFVRLARELATMEQRLDDARRRERAVEESRRELVAWVSHDLRTPLAAIRAMVEALEDGVVTDPETVARYHSTLRAETERLAALVDDLFELSRTQSGTLRLQLERVSLEDLVSDAIAGVAPVAAAKGVRIEGRVDGATDRAGGVHARGAARAAQRARERDPAHADRRRGRGRGGRRGGRRVRVGGRRGWRDPGGRSRAHLRGRLPGGPGADGRERRTRPRDRTRFRRSAPRGHPRR